MHMLLAALLVVSMAIANPKPYAWPTYDTDPGSGGFATITIEYPQHGQHVPGPDLAIRLRSNNSRAAVHVLLDGKVFGANGRPLLPQPQDLNEVGQLEFRKSLVQELPVRDLAPGLQPAE